jgi:hypothetical protein
MDSRHRERAADPPRVHVYLDDGRERWVKNGQVRKYLGRVAALESMKPGDDVSSGANSGGDAEHLTPADVLVCLTGVAVKGNRYTKDLLDLLTDLAAKGSTCVPGRRQSVEIVSEDELYLLHAYRADHRDPNEPQEEYNPTVEQRAYIQRVGDELDEQRRQQEEARAK